jgi:hypothetical protein
MSADDLLSRLEDSLAAVPVPEREALLELAQSYGDARADEIAAELS